MKKLTPAEKLRAKRWDGEFVPCKHHPERRCNRSDYIRRTSRRCASCKLKSSPAKAAYHHSEQRRWKDRSRARHQKIQENKI